MITSSAGNRIRHACTRMAVGACVTAVPLLVALAGHASATAQSDMAAANSSLSTGLCDPGSAAQNHCTDSESRDQVDRTGETPTPPVEYPHYSEYSYGDYEHYGDRVGYDGTYGDHADNDRTSSGERSSHDHHDGHDRS